MIIELIFDDLVGRRFTFAVCLSVNRTTKKNIQWTDFCRGGAAYFGLDPDQEPDPGIFHYI